MARPNKNGVDYFSHDTTSGKTIFTLESKFGNDGYAFWFKLLEILGSQDTLAIDCNNAPDWEYLIAKTKVSEVTATEILDTLSRIKAIDTELWEQKVIWVQKYVDRLSAVFKKRHTETPCRPSFCHRNTSTSVVSVEKSTQRKGKESKVKKTNSECEDFYFQVWKLYPLKKGKAKVKDIQKKKLHSIGLEEISRAIKRYDDSVKDKNFLQHGSTFFNGGYEDYLDANYEDKQSNLQEIKIPKDWK